MHFHCTLSLQLSPERLSKYIFLDFSFALLLSIKVPNENFSLLHYQHFHPLHWRFYGCEDFTLRKSALYPLSHAVHTLCLLVFFVVIENGQTLCPLQLEAPRLKGEKHQLGCVKHT